jgi:signal transduction histidine kinase
MVKTDVDNYQKIVETNELLEREIRLLESLSKNNGVKIANLLHGPVQGKIAGVVLALRIYASNDKAISETEIDRIKKILNSVDRDLDQIINSSNNISQFDFTHSINKLKSNWGELIQVAIVKENWFDAGLLNSYAASMSEVLDEAISNALRHGLASKVEIGISFVNNNLKITVTDDGSGIDENYKPGFGMGVYKDNNFKYSIFKGQNGGSQLILTTSIEQD